MNNSLYLTEEKLCNIISEIYINEQIIFDKAYPGHKFRPDIYLPTKKIVIEFDGHLHYTLAKTVINDINKENILLKDGVKLVRIPYFVQLSTEIFKNIFDIDFIFNQIYPHGFISEKVILPADFCELGIERFLNDLEKFNFIKNDIIKSLKDKINIIDNKRLVIPKVIEKYL
jgi:very-short-patch-repair endonuclease